MNKYLIFYRAPGDKIGHIATVLGADKDAAVDALEEMEDVECVIQVMQVSSLRPR